MDNDITIEISNIDNYTIQLSEQGPQGLQGLPGAQGPPGLPGEDGNDALINGYNTLTMSCSNGITLNQDDNVIDISGVTLQNQLNALPLTYVPLTRTINSKALSSDVVLDYTDLTGLPTIPTVNNPTITFTQGGVTKGSITLNQDSNETVALDEAVIVPYVQNNELIFSSNSSVSVVNEELIFDD